MKHLPWVIIIFLGIHTIIQGFEIYSLQQRVIHLGQSVNKVAEAETMNAQSISTTAEACSKLADIEIINAKSIVSLCRATGNGKGKR